MPMAELKTNVNNSYNTGWMFTVPFGLGLPQLPAGPSASTWPMDN